MADEHLSPTSQAAGSGVAVDESVPQWFATQSRLASRVTRGIERLQCEATRTATRADVARRYTEHRQSINQIRRDIGRSYGFVHRLLVEAGVTMRPRGGNTRGKQ